MASLALGTAQWGGTYGVTNRTGVLSDADVSAIVEEARRVGIDAVDTHRTADPAHGYGHAQERLRPWASGFAITTKVFGGAAADLPVRGQLEESLDRLGVDRVHACLVHDWFDLDDDLAAGTARELDVLMREGLVGRVGISAYDRVDIERAARLFPALGAVQVPLNALDQRLVGEPLMSELGAAGTELQVRSAFLQGLLVDATSGAALSAHPDVIRFHRACAGLAVSPIRAALSFLRSIAWVDQVVVGVTSAGELREIGQAWALSPVDLDWAAVRSHDPGLVDPRLWSR
ncbi:MAG: aldo/keto reductase [Actinomycetota bacterium]|nr:aldo/keto reductase [Actinomycetota bacterium]